MYLKRKLATIAVATTAVLLTACAPTDEDIKLALQKEIDKVNDSAIQMVGKDMASKMQAKLISSKKIDCKSADKNPGYICDVEVTVDLPLVGQQTKTSPMRFVKGDSGWTATEQ